MNRPPRYHLTAYTPLRLALAWLGGTFVLFLLLGNTQDVTNMGSLAAFVGATLAMLTLGYVANIKLNLAHVSVPEERATLSTQEVGKARKWIVAGSLFYLLFGWASLANYGLLSPAAVIQSVLNPGSSYFARLRAAEDLAAAGVTSPLTQLLTLLSAIATPVVPFLVLYWSGRLGFGVRLFAAVGLGTYSAYWLAIGTLKGLGDIVVFAFAAMLVMVFGVWPRPRHRVDRKRVAAAIALGCLFAGYMVINQGQRLVAGDISGYDPNPVVASVLGDQAARGLSVTIAYPTQGYLGLSKNLDTPFSWSGFRGSSRALDGYIEQYTGSPSAYESTYPARTEQRTGYPALMYWATIYPWLASDFTFPGTVLLMAVLGWWLARLWVEAAFLRRRLSVLLFAQLILLVAYIPANNQIGLMRPGLIAFATLAAAYAVAAIHRFLGRQLRPRRSAAAEASGTNRSRATMRVR